MRVSNVNYGRNGSRLGQGDPFKSPREVVFRIIDENGFHVVNPGKKFPFTISNPTWADGTPIPGAPINGTALSEEESPSSSVVRIRLQVPHNPNDYRLQDVPADATLTLYGVNGNVTYPIFAGRRLRFAVPPASPFPLNLQAVYDQVLADKYAAETARQDQIMAEQYAQMIATEEQAQAAAEKARLAAEDAARKKKIADDAIAAATNEKASRETILWAVGALAALGVISYLAFGPSGK